MDEEELIARLSIEDAMSDVMSHIANASLDMADKLEQSGATISSAFDNMSSDVTSAVDSLSSAASNYDRMAGSATNSTDHWTSAVGNYDKSALEATHTTEQLVAEGFKAEDALFQEGEAALKAQVAMDDLRSTSEAAADVKSDLSEVIEAQNRLLENDADVSKMSAEAKLELNRASREAAEAFSDLEKAQTFAGDATEKYDRAYANEQLSLEEVASAAEQARQAAEQLTNAQERANKAAESLAKATDNASKSMGEFGDKSEDSEKKYGDLLEGLAKTAIFAEVISLTKDAAAAVYSLADAYSEAEKVIVNATGATGEALDNMDKSMMSAYSLHHAELSDTAGAIGEINTRMGLMGDKLTDMTGKFLDFSSATGSGTVTSVQEVTKVMNKWHVEQEDTVKVLDMLTYEAQKSGASVDNLASSLITGAASFQQVDLSLGSTISLLGELELQGINSSTVIMGLKTAVKNFSDDGLNAGEALRSTIDKIANMRSEAEATSLAIDTFGSRAGVELANAIRSGAITVEMLNTDLAEAEGTLKKTAEAGETLSEKWDKSSNKIKTAFTNALAPALEKTSNFFADITGRLGDFLAEHETLTKVLTVMGTTLGAVAVGFTALTFAVNTAIPAIKTFVTSIGTTVMANPRAAAVIGIAALTAGLIALGVALSDSSDGIEGYNGTLEECSKEIENTRLAHQKAVELYGEETDAAKQLENQLNTLNAQYEKGGGIIEDYAQRADDGAKKLADFEKQYHERVQDISDNQTAGLVMVSQLEALRGKAEKTNFDLDLMAKYADYLNDTFECNIKVNYNTGELTGFDPKIITDSIIQQMSQAMYQAEIDTITDDKFTTGYVNALKRLPVDISNVNNTHEAYIKAQQEEGKSQSPMGMGVNIGGSVEAYNKWSTASDTLSKTENEIKGYESRIRSAFTNIGLPAEEAERYIENLKTTAEGSKTMWESLAEGINGLVHPVSEYRTEFDAFSDRYKTFIKDGELSTEELVSLVQAAPEEVQSAISDFTNSVTELQTAYDDVYNSAYESYQGQYSLFEKLDYDMDNHVLNTEAFKNATIQNAQEALDSQLAYWTQYSENMDFITSYAAGKLNVSKEDWDSFVTYLGSGTEEAAGLLNEVQALLEQGDAEAVEKLVNTRGELKNVHKDTADDLAEFETDYDKKMQELVESTTKAIQDMEIPNEAKSAATKTMDAYLASIKAGGDKAVTEAEGIAQRIANALNVSANVNVNTTSSGTVPGHASGTTYAEDVFIAGENGPELIVGKGGSTVFPTSETEKILNAVGSLGHSETASLSMGSNFIPEKMNGLDGLTDRLESVFIPILGKTVEIASDMISIASRDMNVPEREQTLIMPTENEYSFDEQQSSKTEKKITIEVQGSGSIEIEKGADKETMLEVLQENLKPVLMNIISSEIYEEGDDSYDY